MSDILQGITIRRQIISVIVIGYFALMVVQLFRVQILDQKQYDERSRANSIKGIKQPAPRGILYDRNKKVIVGNQPSFTLRITPNKYDSKRSEIIENVLNVDSGYVDKLLVKKSRYSRFLPASIKRDVNYEVISWYEEQADSLPGVDYIIDMRRDYSFGINGSHFLGYTKEITASQLKKSKDHYDLGDQFGFKGLEKTYEKYLKGTKGVSYFVVDSKGKTIGRYVEGKNDIPPLQGNHLILTIDYKTQKTAEEEFKQYTGAVVAIEPASGEILAFVSSPEYELSEFASVLTEKWWKKLSTDPRKPLFNRATMSIYPPGSTFKMIAAVAALEEGVVSPNWSVNCKGGLQFGDRFFKCTHHHGKTNMAKAIEVSCNTYFYELSIKLGIDKWSKYAKKFGFGQKTKVDISEESSGLMPDRNYYNRVFGKRGWTDGVMLNLIIGQGELGVTPLQLALYTSLLANNGKTKVPHFVKAYVDKVTQEIVPFEYNDKLLEISASTLDIIHTGMENVFSGKDGTVNHLTLNGIKLAGKTGTSQNPFGENHSVFVAYAPADNPKIAIAVFVENVGFGSTYAAPVALKVIDAYLNKSAPELNQTKQVALSNLGEVE